MVLGFDLSFGFISSSASNFLSIAIGILIIFGFLWTFTHIGSKGEHKREKKVEQEDQNPKLKELAAELEALQDRLRKDEAAVEAEDDSVRKDIDGEGEDASGPEKRANRAERKAEDKLHKENEDDDRIVQDAEEIEREVTAEVAAAETIKDRIKQEIEHELELTQVEEKEVAILEALESRIGNLNALRDINQATAQFLHEYFSKLSDHSKRELSFEKNREKSRHNLVVICKDMITNMKEISEFANKKKKDLNKAKNRERKNFKGEIKSLDKALKAKRKEIREESKQEKNADANLIAQVQKEVEILSKNRATLKIVAGRLEDTESNLKDEIRKLKQLMKSVVETVNEEKKKEDKLKNREKDIPKSIKEMEEKQEEFSEKVGKLNGTGNLHVAAIQLSSKMKNYSEHYIKVLEEDSEFTELLEEMMKSLYHIMQKISMLTPLVLGILKSSEALENGTAALEGILAMGLENDISSDIKTQEATIQEEVAILEKQERLVLVLEEIEKEVEQGLLDDVALVERLRSHLNKLIAENQELYKQESAHLGKSMATSLAAKEVIRKGYGKTVDNFAENLKQSNAEAAAEFYQSRRAA